MNSTRAQRLCILLEQTCYRFPPATRAYANSQRVSTRSRASIHSVGGEAVGGTPSRPASATEVASKEVSNEHLEPVSHAMKRPERARCFFFSPSGVGRAELRGTRVSPSTTHGRRDHPRERSAVTVLQCFTAAVSGADGIWPRWLIHHRPFGRATSPCAVADLVLVRDVHQR